MAVALAGTGASPLATIPRFLEERHEPGPVNIFADAVFPEARVIPEVRVFPEV
jgi:hypothetical protein